MSVYQHASLIVKKRKSFEFVKSMLFWPTFGSRLSLLESNSAGYSRQAFD